MDKSVNSIKEIGDETRKIRTKFVDDLYALLRC